MELVLSHWVSGTSKGASLNLFKILTVSISVACSLAGLPLETTRFYCVYVPISELLRELLHSSLNRNSPPPPAFIFGVETLHCLGRNLIVKAVYQGMQI